MRLKTEDLLNFEQYIYKFISKNSERIRELESSKVGKEYIEGYLQQQSRENVGNKCKECKVMDCAMRVMKTLQFAWSNGNVGIGDEPNKFRSALKYDKNTNEILIDEEMLMDAIKLANPGQKSRRIRLISGTE